MLRGMTTLQRPRLARDAAEHAEDLAAIEAIIADVERAMNTNDAELGVRHFAADARGVDVRGREHSGADALLAAHQAGFAGPLADQYAAYEIAQVDFVRPDVALVAKRATAVDANGTPLDVGHAMVALYVLVREDGRWWIAARQNTLTAAPA